MKKIYFLSLSLVTGMLMAQETISFESAEGFTLGTLNGQNGWEVTEGSDGILTNQIISDEQASDGVYAFKNSYEPDFNPLFIPVFGASKSFEEALPFDSFSISYDIFVTEQEGSDFEFTAFGINDTDEFNPVAGIGIEKNGLVYFIKNSDYEIEFIDGVSWLANTWYNVKIEVSANEIKYYLDDELIYTGANFSQLYVSGFNMLHNNYGGSAYYDNIKINGGAMATVDLNQGEVSVYPNPVRDFVNVLLSNNELVKSIEVISVSGQKVLEVKSAEKINVQHLNKGVYVLKINSNSGKVYTKKFVKQ